MVDPYITRWTENIPMRMLKPWPTKAKFLAVLTGLFALVGISLIGASSAQAAGPFTVNIPARACTIDEANPSTMSCVASTDRTTYSSVTDATSGSRKRLLVWFDMSSIPANATITSGTLYADGDTTSNSGNVGIQVRDILRGSALNEGAAPDGPTWTERATMVSPPLVGWYAGGLLYATLGGSDLHYQQHSTTWPGTATHIGITDTAAVNALTRDSSNYGMWLQATDGDYFSAKAWTQKVTYTTP